MINTKEFDEIRKEMKVFEAEREKQIQKSREIIQTSKRIIYAVQRDDLKEAKKLRKEIEHQMSKLGKLKYDLGIDSVAQQEYVEAITFLEFVDTGKLIGRKELKVDTHSYLLGLCDLTGELVRRAVNAVIKRKFDEAERIKDIVTEIYGEFLKMELRNGELRKKSDTIKWNLTKIEDLFYDIHIKDKRK